MATGAEENKKLTRKQEVYIILDTLRKQFPNSAFMVIKADIVDERTEINHAANMTLADKTLVLKGVLTMLNVQEN